MIRLVIGLKGVKEKEKREKDRILKFSYSHKTTNIYRFFILFLYL